MATEAEKLIRDIKTLKESIQRDWHDLGTKNLSPGDRADIRKHIDSCDAELRDLRERLDSLPESN